MIDKVAIFDMDRTLTRRGTWVGWLAFWLRHEAPWRAALLPLLAGPALAYRAGRLGRGELKAAAQRLAMGRRVPGAQVRAAAARYAAQVVAHELFDGAGAALAEARAGGARLVIATASNAYYAEAIGAALGVDHVIATRFNWADDHLLPQLASANCYGEAKRAAVQAWLLTAGLEAATVSAWSDHVSDLPLLELAAASGGQAVAANASPALRAEAQARGWAMVDWGPVRGSLLERA
ncbi:HAD family hydrolase [Polymorphobacter sp.]|uniref:HAD family hydrolase n=1 Tax=Polymorphobacter sp. TaxID=1909290 RepID=UPI003F6EB222